MDLSYISWQAHFINSKANPFLVLFYTWLTFLFMPFLKIYINWHSYTNVIQRFYRSGNVWHRYSIIIGYSES